MMKLRDLVLVSLCGSVSVAWAEEPAKVTYDDHIKPILREHCTSCHNSNDKKSGLALDTYQSVLTGGSGGEVVAAGDLDSSRLYALTAHKEQPYMPPNQDMIPQAKVDLLKTWIEQGMPENSGSAIKKPKANAMALTVVAGRPEGPPPMPTSMLKQTPFSTQRAATTSAIAASPWSPLVAVGGQMQVSLYHSESGHLLGILPFPEGEPQSITFSRDGRLVLVGGGKHSQSGFAALYEISTGNRIAKVGDELDTVMGADISDDNQWIALAGPQKMVRVYETLTGQLKYEQKKHTDWIYSVRFSPDGLLLATADRAGGLIVWEALSGRLYLDLQGHKGEIRSITWRPDSQALISSSLDGTLKMWEMNEGKVIKSWDAHGGGAMAVAVCNDGTMVSTGKDNKVKIWDANGNAAGEMPALIEAGHEVAITVDGKQIVAGDWAGNVRMWQRANPAQEIQLPANPQPLDAMLASTQATLNQVTGQAQAAQADYTAKSSQQSTIQKQVTDLQSQLAALTSQIAANTQMQTAIKPEWEALNAQFKVKSDEFATVQAARNAKQQLLDAANANKKRFDDEAVAFTASKGAEGADVASLDMKIAESKMQSEVQVAALKQLTDEIAPLNTDAANREKQIAEMKPLVDAKNQEWNGIATKLQEAMAAKAKLEPQVEPMNVALKTATDAANASKTQLDALNAQVASAQAQAVQLQSDIAVFQSRQKELLDRRTTLEQSMAGIAKQMEPVEASVNTTKGQADSINAEITKLEAQLAALQLQMKEQQALKATVMTDLSAKQQSLDALKTQSQQMESDAANAALQLQLFEEAYGKKP